MFQSHQNSQGFSSWKNSKIKHSHGRYLRLIPYNRDVPYKTWPVAWSCNWYFYTSNTAVKFQKNRDYTIHYFNTVYHGSESISCLGPKLWEIFQVKINEFSSRNSFKKEIRNWVAQNCPCRLRIQCISGVGFLPWCLVVFAVSKIFAFLFYCEIQGGLNKKEIQLNLCNIFSTFIFNELYLFV